jgi:hypothetical protein
MGPFGTSATEWPIVLAPGDYDDREFGGMKIGRGNRSTRRKPAPAPLCGRGGKPATNGLSYGAAIWTRSFAYYKQHHHHHHHLLLANVKCKHVHCGDMT